MLCLAIDPGPTESAYVLWDGKVVSACAIMANESLIATLGPIKFSAEPDAMVVEKIECMGMAVGAETFETVWWSGRFADRWERLGGLQDRMPRRSVKMHLCQSMRAKDANIRQALIDRFGKPGTTKNPGVLFGISSHKWAALAIAVTYIDQQTGHV